MQASDAAYRFYIRSTCSVRIPAIHSKFFFILMFHIQGQLIPCSNFRSDQMPHSFNILYQRNKNNKNKTYTFTNTRLIKYFIIFRSSVCSRKCITNAAWRCLLIPMTICMLMRSRDLVLHYHSYPRLFGPTPRQTNSIPATHGSWPEAHTAANRTFNSHTRLTRIIRTLIAPEFLANFVFPFRSFLFFFSAVSAQTCAA